MNTGDELIEFKLEQLRQIGNNMQKLKKIWFI